MSKLDEQLAAVAREIDNLEPEAAMQLLGKEGVCFVDLRDGFEQLEHGLIPGAEHCPRGSLEFRIPADSKFHRSFFAEAEHFVFYCSHGQRSILATRTAMDLGLPKASHIKGGLLAWVAAGGPVVKLEQE
jgi:rhodanese-related sulfurtransferase